MPYTLPPAHLFRLGHKKAISHILKIAVVLSGVSYKVNKTSLANMIRDGPLFFLRGVGRREFSGK